MNLTLQRERSTETRTFGVLFVNGDFQCHTLEDPVRDVKIPGVTAIPAGEYLIQVTSSPKFGRMLPVLLNVPNFIGVRIHPGNKVADTEGCILPGQTRSGDQLLNSRLAFDPLYLRILDALNHNEQVRLRIRPADLL